MKALQAVSKRPHLWCGAGAAVSYLGWLRGSYDATHHLELLTKPVIPGLSFLRHDTVAAVCGIVSAALFLLCIYLWAASLPSWQRWAYTLSCTGSIYGASGWYYITQNKLYHPWSLRMPLTHFLSFPHESTFGSVCVIVTVMSVITLGAFVVVSLRTRIQQDERRG